MSQAKSAEKVVKEIWRQPAGGCRPKRRGRDEGRVGCTSSLKLLHLTGRFTDT